MAIDKTFFYGLESMKVLVYLQILFAGSSRIFGANQIYLLPTL